MSKPGPRRGTASLEVTDNDIKEAFEVFDGDKDGYILSDEIGTVIRALGKCPYQSEVQAIIDEAGGEGKKVNLSTFTGFYKRKIRRPMDLERDMRNAFSALDKDGNGNVLEAELRQILGSLGEALSSDEVDLLMRDLQVDDEGQIKYDRFVDMLVS